MRKYQGLRGCRMSLLAGLQYALRAGLFKEMETSEAVRVIRGRILITQSLYAIATADSVVFPTWVTIALIFLIQLNYVIARRIPVLTASDRVFLAQRS